MLRRGLAPRIARTPRVEVGNTVPRSSVPPEHVPAAATSDPTDIAGPAELATRAAAVGEDVRACLALARDVGTTLPPPGGGGTAERFSALRAVARANLTAARVLEAHTDALAILAEAVRVGVTDGGPVAGATWGVFAAEAPGALLTATPTRAGYRLDGVKPWCSLAADLDRALVTAHVEGGRQLFAVDLGHAGVTPSAPDGWVARGLRTVVSVPVHFDAVPAEPVGEPGWYLERSGFAWGGIGVAVCWLGGAEGLADALLRHARRRDDDLEALHVGTVDVALHAAAAVLADAAARIDAGRADGADGAVLALRVRAVVAGAVEDVLRSVGHALGPAALAFDADVTARTADLTLYVRQHHGERDLAALGHDVVDRARRVAADPR